MAAIIIRYADFAEITLPETRDYIGFNDSEDISDYAKEGIETLNKAEIIDGRPDNLFAPKDNATRAEFAVVLFRFLEAIETFLNSMEDELAA